MTLLRPGLLRNNRPRGNGVAALRLATLFDAPLTTSIVPMRAGGSATPTFSRTSTAYVRDHENIERLALVGEARFWGARRVRNLFTFSETFSNAAWQVFSSATKVAAGPTTGLPAGASSYEISFGATGGAIASAAAFYQAVAITAGRVYVMSFWVRAVAGSTTIRTSLQDAPASNIGSADIAITTTWQRLSQVVTCTADNPAAVFCLRNNVAGNSGNIYVAAAQLEGVTGQSVQTPSEYVSTGVLSTPYQGANVDGVQYLDTVRLHTQNLLIQSEDVSNAVWTVAGMASKGGGTLINLPAVNDYVNQACTNFAPQPGQATVASVMLSGTGTVTIFVVRVAGGGYEQSVSKQITLTSTPIWYDTNVFTPTVPQAGQALRIIRDATDTAASVNVHKAMLCRSGVPSILTGSANYTTTAATANIGTDTGTTALIPATTACGYLSEAAATNYLGFSSGFSNAYWIKTDIATGPTDNSVVSPTGATAASQWTEGVAGTAAVAANNTITPYPAGSRVTWSIYLRLGPSAPQSWCRIRIFDTVTPADGVTVWANLSTGTIGAPVLAGAATQSAATITNVGLGWYRVSVTCLPNALSTAASCTVISATGDGSTTRVNSSVFQAWASMLEVGTTPTSPVETTTSATVGRSADVLNYSPTGNFSMSLGSVYAEFKFPLGIPVSSGRVVGVTGAVNNGSLLMVGATFSLQMTDNTTYPLAGSAMVAYVSYKGASAWGGATMSLAGGDGPGTAFGAAFDGTMADTPTILGVGCLNTGSQVNGTVRNVRIYNQKLADAQLTAMVA